MTDDTTDDPTHDSTVEDSTDGSTDDRRGRPSSSRRPRRGAVLAATVVLSAVAASAAASAALSEEPPVPLENQMQSEIDAMIESGVDPDDPKVEMLEDSLEQLEEGADANPRPEPGVDVEALLDEAAEDEASEDAAVASRSADPGAVAADGHGGDDAWQSGEVMCEVVPGMLGPEEIAGARCVSVPQPDGTSRYVAIGPDGTVRTVMFGHDRHVERVADSAVGAAVAPDAAVAATPAGDLVVTPPGQPSRPVDLR